MIYIKKKYHCTVWALLFAVTVFSQSNKILLSELDNPLLETATAGIAIFDIETDSCIFSYNARKSLLPASIQKLVTSMAALDKLGPSYRFTTSFAVDGTIKDNVLDGNLIIKGGGDPTLASKYFDGNTDDLFATVLDSLKLKKINGDIIADISHFDKQYIHPTWTWQDIGNYYGGGVYGLSFADNTYRLHFNTNLPEGADAELRSISPEMPDLHMHNYVTVAKPGSGDLSYIFGTSQSAFHEIRGTLAKQQKEYIVKGAMPRPYETFARMLGAYMNEHGCEFTGNVKILQQSSDSLNVLFSLYSPELKDILYKMNHESINHFADHIFKELIAVDGKEGCFDLASEYVENYIDSITGEKGININDGSGLSRFNTLTAMAMAELLTNFSTDENFEVLFKSLPVAGQSGTMKYFGRNSELAGKVFAKTGTMTRVRSLVGYIKAKSGKMYSFAVIVNGFDEESKYIRRWMENFLSVFYSDR